MEAMNDKIDKLLKKIEDMERALGKKYDEIKGNIKTTIDNQEILNQTLRKIQKENKLYKEEIMDLKERIEYLERNSLDTTLNLYPVVETENMDISAVLQKIGKKTGVKIEEGDIVEKYRKPTKKSGKPGDIIIKCTSKVLRDKIIDGIKKVKLTHEDIGIKCDLGRIYGNEELTREGKNIFYKAQRYKFEEKWKFLWVKSGKIYMKKDEGSRAIRLDNMDILEKLCK